MRYTAYAPLNFLVLYPFHNTGLTEQKSETENWIIRGFQVVSNFYFQCAKFEGDKHRFEQLLWRRQLSTVFNKTAWGISFTIS